MPLRDRVQAVLLTFILIFSLPSIPILIPLAFLIPGPGNGTGTPGMLIIFAIPISIMIYIALATLLSPYFWVVAATYTLASILWGSLG